MRDTLDRSAGVIECGTGFARNTPRSGEQTQTDSLLSRYVDLLRQQVVGLGSRRLRRRVFGKPCPALGVIVDSVNDSGVMGYWE